MRASRQLRYLDMEARVGVLSSFVDTVSIGLPFAFHVLSSQLSDSMLVRGTSYDPRFWLGVRIRRAAQLTSRPITGILVPSFVPTALAQSRSRPCGGFSSCGNHCPHCHLEDVDRCAGWRGVEFDTCCEHYPPSTRGVLDGARSISGSGRAPQEVQRGYSYRGWL